mgnify:CR=1 FL=1
MPGDLLLETRTTCRTTVRDRLREELRQRHVKSAQTCRDRQCPSPLFGSTTLSKRAIASSTSRVMRGQTLLSKSLASQSSTLTAPGKVADSESAPT